MTFMGYQMGDPTAPKYVRDAFDQYRAHSGNGWADWSDWPYVAPADKELEDDLAMMRFTGRYSDADLERYAAIYRGTWSYARQSINDTMMSGIKRVVSRILKTVGAGR